MEKKQLKQMKRKIVKIQKDLIKLCGNCENIKTVEKYCALSALAARYEILKENYKQLLCD